MDPRAVGKRLVFISIYGSGGGVVDIYRQGDKHQQMVGQITGLQAEGLATETDGTLYVANSTVSGVGNILVYAPPYTKPPKLTLDDPGYFPNGIAISRRGVVAVRQLLQRAELLRRGERRVLQKELHGAMRHSRRCDELLCVATRCI